MATSRVLSLTSSTIPDVVLPSLRCVASHSRAVSVASCGTRQITLKPHPLATIITSRRSAPLTSLHLTALQFR